MEEHPWKLILRYHLLLVERSHVYSVQLNIPLPFSVQPLEERHRLGGPLVRRGVSVWQAEQIQAIHILTNSFIETQIHT